MNFSKLIIKNLCRILIVFVVFNAINSVSCSAYASLKETGNSKKVMVTKDIKKVWQFKFNKNIDRKSLNAGVYVLDSKDNKIKIKVKLSKDKRTVEISPLTKYEINKDYRIFIKNIKGEKGEKISNEEIYYFKVEPQNSNIVSVKTNVNAMITYFEINTSKEVFKITINDVEMKYEGTNKYELGLQDLDKGKKIIIKAFDSNNKLLEQKDYNLDK